MHRITKEHDINHGKWIGVGGKFEWGETPEECMRREVREETGLRVDQYRYCGIVTFVSDEDDMEYMHLFTVTGFHDPNGAFVRDARSVNGSAKIGLKTCAEGRLEWLPKEQLTRIPHWAGDRIFLPLVLDTEVPFFSMKLVYRSGELVHASLNEHNCLVTDRLVLRPWLAWDAESLFRHVKNPEIGPRAGWRPHTDVAMSLRSIREVLTRPEIYAIVPRGMAEPVGSVGLQNFRLTDRNGKCFTFFDERQSEDPLACTRPADAASSRERGTAGEGFRVEAALGYWLAKPYWHQGLMTEAAGAVLAHAKRDLGISRVWADYYEGNEASGRVMQRLGFHYHHREEDRYLEQLDEKRTAIVYVKALESLADHA